MAGAIAKEVNVRINAVAGRSTGIQALAGSGAPVAGGAPALAGPSSAQGGYLSQAASAVTGGMGIGALTKLGAVALGVTTALGLLKFAVTDTANTIATMAGPSGMGEAVGIRSRRVRAIPGVNFVQELFGFGAARLELDEQARQAQIARVGLANPALTRRLQMATEDMEAVRGRGEQSVIAGLERRARLLGDAEAAAQRQANNAGLRDAVQRVRETTHGFGIEEERTERRRLEQLYGGRLPSSFGAAVRPAAFLSADEYSRKAQLAAYMGGAADPAQQTAENTASIRDMLSALGRAVAAWRGIDVNNAGIEGRR